MSQKNAKNKKAEVKYLPKNLNIKDYDLRQTLGKGSHSIIKLSKAMQSNKFFAVKKIKQSFIIQPLITSKNIYVMIYPKKIKRPF